MPIHVHTNLRLVTEIILGFFFLMANLCVFGKKIENLNEQLILTL